MCRKFDSCRGHHVFLNHSKLLSISLYLFISPFSGAFSYTF